MLNEEVEVQKLQLNKRHLLVATIVAVWCVGVVGGLTILFQYANRPAQASLLQSWPQNTTLSLDSVKPTLVVVMHPQCSCSRATIAELKNLARENAGSMNIITLFIRPNARDLAWVKGELFNSAESIASNQLFVDASGTEAKNFKAETSGQAFLFEPSGRLVFSGGITASRGHVGPNFGEQTLNQYLQKRTVSSGSTTGPVFGCALFSHGQAALQTERSL